MKKYKNVIYYVSVIGILSIVMYFILSVGKNMEVHNLLNGTTTDKSAWDNFLTSTIEEATGSTALLLLQIIVILIFVRFFGWICQKLGQPTVIGEIIAGIVLGPSLLGLFFPEISVAIFPPSSIGSIKLLSEIGLVLFMFIVGMELDMKFIKTRIRSAVLISHTCIAFLFVMGATLAYFIYPHFTHSQTPFIPFALFMGIAMSITAFPVLARIVHERGLNKTALGGMAITCAAVDDITAWCLLAAVIAITKAGTFISSLYVILFAVLYVIVMFKLVRPFLKRVADLQTSKNIINKTVVGIFFLVLFLSSYTTSVIGIHPLFGAFLAGVIMPPNMNFRKLFVDKIEDVSLTLLLPLFFVYTGLNTKIGLLNSPELWMLSGIIIIIATIGKLFGGTLTARFTGLDWQSSLTIGTLMNTRGLMELIVLNIGLELGILTSEVFAMMVVMALVTTFLTSPLLNLLEKIFRNKPQREILPEKKPFRIMISFEDTELGKQLLLIANAFVKKDKANAQVNMVHISPGNNLYQYNIEDEERDIFEPILEEAKVLDQPVNPIFLISSNPFSQIIKMGNNDNYDFVLLGVQGSIFEGNLLGQLLGFSNKILNFPTRVLLWVVRHKRAKKTRVGSLDEGTRIVLTRINVPVGVFIDKGLINIKSVFVPILDEDDIFIGEFMERLVGNSYVRITLWDGVGLLDKSIDFTKSVRNIKAINPYLFQLWNNNIEIDKDILKKQDLVLVSLKSWKNIKEINKPWVKSIPSMLLLNG